MTAMIALAIKDLRVLLRVRAALFFTLVWPIIIAVLFGFVFSGAAQDGRAEIRIAVVDEDQTAPSRAYLQRLEDSAEIETTAAPRGEAEDLVRRGQRAAFVVIRKGFGERSGQLFYGPSRQVEIGIDPSRLAEAGMLQGLLIKYAMEDVQQFFTNPAASREMVQKALADVRTGAGNSALAPVERFLGELDTFLAAPPPAGAPDSAGADAWQPLAVTTTSVQRARVGPANAFAVTFPQGVMWGLIGCVMSFAISLVSERVRGTLLRLRMAPLGRAQILGGKALACLAAMIVLQLILFGLGAIVFGIRPDSWSALAAIGLSSALGFVGFMMLIAGIGRTEQGTSGAGWAMLMPMTLFGGGMMPQFIMPSWMVTMGTLSPVTWVIRGMEGAIWRGFSAAEMALPCAILLAFGAVCFALGVRALDKA